MKKGFLFGLGILLSGVVLAAVVSVSSIPIKSPGDPLSAAELNQIVGTLEGVSNDGGNVGIGTNQPQAKLHVNGSIHADFITFTNGSNPGVNSIGRSNLSSRDLRINAERNMEVIINEEVSYSSAYFAIKKDSPTANPLFKVDLTGTATAAAFTPTSSKVYKKNIEKLSKDGYQKLLEDLQTIDLVQYHFNTQDDSSQKNLGVIAEEIPKTFVTEDGKHLRLGDLVSSLIGAVKVQQEQIELLQNEIQSLKTN